MPPLLPGPPLADPHEAARRELPELGLLLGGDPQAADLAGGVQMVQQEKPAVTKVGHVAVRERESVPSLKATQSQKVRAFIYGLP